MIEKEVAKYLIEFLIDQMLYFTFLEWAEAQGKDPDQLEDTIADISP